MRSTKKGCALVPLTGLLPSGSVRPTDLDPFWKLRSVGQTSSPLLSCSGMQAAIVTGAAQPTPPAPPATAMADADRVWDEAAPVMAPAKKLGTFCLWTVTWMAFAPASLTAAVVNVLVVKSQ